MVESAIRVRSDGMTAPSIGPNEQNVYYTLLFLCLVSCTPAMVVEEVVFIVVICY
jgi:hypothetical protein